VTLQQNNTGVAVLEIKSAPRDSESNSGGSNSEQYDAQVQERNRYLAAERLAVRLRLFDEPLWPPSRAESWIMFRAPELIAQNCWGAIMYETPEIKQRIKEQEPSRQLVHALQSGRLKAHHRDGTEWPRQAFAESRGIRWSNDIYLDRESVLALWPIDLTQPAKQPPKPAKLDRPSKPHGRRGRIPKWDWPDIAQFIHKKMDENGDFNEWDAGFGWQGQSDLQRLVLGYITETLKQEEPSESTLKEHVVKALDEWRRGKGQ
jgi:hypothetical protein